jgi:hypothetical protein
VVGSDSMESNMSFRYNDVTVPVMLQGLAVMDDYLDHAKSWGAPSPLIREAY